MIDDDHTSGSPPTFRNVRHLSEPPVWDPMIKSRPQAALVERAFRHVHVSSSTEITMEFSFVGMQRCREGAIGSNRSFGGSMRESATAFPHTTQICDISSDRLPDVSENCRGQV
jgi:hypothetical protein